MNGEDCYPANESISARVGQLAAGSVKTSAPNMLNEALDHNGNLLMGMDQIIIRLNGLVERMVGPQPRAESERDEGKPEGALHILGSQQNIMDSKLREMVNTIEQLESLA